MSARQSVAAPLVPRPPDRPMTARDRSHRPVGRGRYQRGSDSSPGVRKQRFSREEGSRGSRPTRLPPSAGALSTAGMATSSLPEPSSTFITDVPTPVHRPEPTIVLQDPRLSLNRHHIVTDHVTLTLDQRCKRAQDRFRPAPSKPEKASDEGSSSHLPSVDGEEKSRGQRERQRRLSRRPWRCRRRSMLRWPSTREASPV